MPRLSMAMTLLFSLSLPFYLIMLQVALGQETPTQPASAAQDAAPQPPGPAPQPPLQRSPQVFLSQTAQETQAGFSCFRCASPELRDAWYLTDIPKQYAADELYTTTCNSDAELMSKAVGSQMLTETCRSTCMTLVLDATKHPELIAAGRFNSYVRGCYDTLTGIEAVKPSVECEVGKTTYFNPRDKDLEDMNLMLFYCNESNCNTQMHWKFRSCQRRRKLTCRDCPEQGAEDCDTRTCSAPFCTVRRFQRGNKTVVSRGCSEVNLFTTSGCQTTNFSIAAAPPSLLLSPAVPPKPPTVVTSEVCFCAKDNCNAHLYASGAMRRYAFSLRNHIFALSLACFCLLLFRQTV